MIFGHPSFDDHERVICVHDAPSGLKAVIAIHNSALGPATGGCRLRSYSSEDQAIGDVLRLSQGMSYKNAMAGLAMGGGKAVVFGPVDAMHRSAVFEAFGRAVDGLRGDYLTAQDLGVSQDDLASMERQTRYVVGAAKAGILRDGPAYFTARGTLRGMEAGANHAFGTSDLSGRRIVVQGVGSVGTHLVHLLTQAGARVFIADVDLEAAQAVSSQTGADVIPLETCLAQDVDIVAPCAVGGVITEQLAKAMPAQLIAGAANNQIASPEVGDTLVRRGIVYVPDYVINAGGMVALAAQYFGDGDESDALKRIDAIGLRTDDILSRAAREGRPTQAVADDMARHLLRGEQAAQ